MNTYDDITIMRCRSANAAQLAACHTEEAEFWARRAQEAAPEEDWGLDDPSGMGDPGRGLPDGWAAIAEEPLSTEAPEGGTP